MENGDDDDKLTPLPRSGATVTLEELLRLAGDRLLLAGNAMMDLAPRLERNTEALLSLRRATYEREEAHDQRERSWSFTLDKIGTANAEAIAKLEARLAGFQSELAALTNTIEISKQLGNIVDGAKATAVHSQVAADEAHETLAAIDNISRRLDEVTDQHKALVEESVEEKRVPWYAWLANKFLSGFWNAPLRSHVTLVLILILAAAVWGLSSALKDAAEKRIGVEQSAPVEKK